MSSSSAKTGTTVFAYFYLVVSVLSSLQVVFFLYRIADMKCSGKHLAVSSFISGVIIPIITLTFASILVHGVRRKNPNCLTAFIVFGVIKILLAVAVSIYLAINHEACREIFFLEFCQPILLLIPIILCVIFGGILVMIGFAANKYRKERQLKPNSIYDPLTMQPVYASAPTETFVDEKNTLKP